MEFLYYARIKPAISGLGAVDAGENKFDGRYITRYSTREGLSNNSVWNMLQDKDGDIWFATDNSLNRYNGHSFTHYTTAQGLPADTVRGIFQDSKGLYGLAANVG